MHIDSFSGEFSVHAGRITMMINGEKHDISNLFPKHSYSHAELAHPEINWKIRTEMLKVIRNYVKNLDSEFPVGKIIC